MLLLKLALTVVCSGVRYILLCANKVIFKLYCTWTFFSYVTKL